MLPLTTLMYIDTIKNDNPKELNVAIHRSIQCKPVQYFFAKFMAATKPTMMKYKSKGGVNDVAFFRRETKLQWIGGNILNTPPNI